MTRSRELAKLLLHKAAQDEYAFRRLWEDPQAPQEIALFHAQQAVEKMIKAVLALSAVRPKRTHDLAALIELARDNGISFPKELEGITKLTPFAAYFRYEDGSPIMGEVIHWIWVKECVRQTRVWAESILREHAGESES